MLGGTSLPDSPRQQSAGAHVAPREADANEQERGPRARRADAKIGRESDHGTRTGAYAVHRRAFRPQTVNAQFR